MHGPCIFNTTNLNKERDKRYFMTFWIIKWLGNCSIIGWQVGLGQGESVAAVEQLCVDHESW